MAEANTNTDQQIVDTSYDDPDYYEVLESYEAEEETALHDKRKGCKKDPEHTGFIPVADFTLEHLPEGYRDQLRLDYIMAVVDLTVRLVVSHISSDRPDNYFLSKLRGKNVRSYGSGKVRRIDRKYADMDGESCPCPQCDKLPEKDKKKQWGEYGVWTALHVVFDDKESRHTQADVDYNTDSDRNTCPKLHGVSVGYDFMDEDSRWAYVVSHDREICLMLEKRFKRYNDLREKLKQCRGDKLSKYPPIVCVSHPHGMSKHVTVGKFKHETENWPYKWRYTTPTCPGSSGAPVCCLGEDKEVAALTPDNITFHSGNIRLHGENESGRMGWYT